jgi:hypothetical protein
MTQNLALLTLPVVLSGVCAAQRFVTATGALAAAGANTLGVARCGAGVGAVVPVDVLGTAVVEAGGAIAQGDTLKTDADGRAITWATSGAKVAIALQAASAAGQPIEVLLLPNA